ncbi:TonB-dependent receptor [Novosphingobium sp. SG720]|uniref:TonB-dependent receptor n=1 Tax=Novosphingobium sp. SG720 TaxID=2586998 RepID=UPI0018328FAE|nr:TonB-dependent receptor [Novosphingobium sp. SG720]NKJ42977.1 iron complex outermembrane receptor protein [Novosphingobium sp. SG720]
MRISGSALACALVFAMPAQAAEPAPAAAEKANGVDTGFSIGEQIVVSARSMAASSQNVLTSIDRMGGDVAQRANVNYAWELVGRLPGVMLTNFNQGTTSGKFSFRGFNGEGEINAVKLLIDGVPANSNDGNMPYIDAVFPLDIAGIEVVRGTSDPRYGVHAIAGSANIQTRIGGNYLEGKVSGGSFDTYEAQAVAGIEKGRFSQNYLAAWRQAGGWRDHGGLTRGTLAGKWFFRPSEDVRIGAIARWYRGTADEPGYLTLENAAANPRMTNAYNRTDGDTRTVAQGSLHLDASLGDTVDFTAKAYANRLRDDRYVKFSATTSQQRRVTDEDHYGASAALHWHARVAGVPVMAEVGGDMQWQDNVSLRYNTVARVVTAQTRDQAFTTNIGGVYAQVRLEPAPWLTISPGWRLDWVGGTFHNRLTGTTAPINDYGTISQPKLQVAITPVSQVTLYGNYGKSFQIGVGSGAYLIPPRTTDLAPSINEGWEAGVKLRPVAGVEARVALWLQDASGEIKRKLNDPLGDSENVGATRRRGVDVQVNVRPVAGVSAWGALSWQTSRIRVADPATPTYIGHEIDHVPHWLWSGGVDLTPSARWRVSVWGNGQSSYWLTTANDPAVGKFGQYAVFNAEVAFRPLERLEKLELALTGKNLFDRAYEYVWYDSSITTSQSRSPSAHSPAEGLGLTASARVRF